MAHEEETGKSQAEMAQRAWELAKSIGTPILATWDGKEQSLRPMSSTVKMEERAIYFLAAVDSPPVEHIAKYPGVALGYADGTKFVTFNGTAQVSNDRGLIEKLWSPFAKAWWDSAQDPSIRAIVVSPQKAEVWDGANKLVAGAVMLTAAVTGAKPAVGDHAKVSL